ncbi:MAG: MotA/TolQ/ExbB proton channel family protein [Myxococcota bacterium]
MTDLQHLFQLGGPTMYAIAAVAVFGITLFLERLFVVFSLIGQIRTLERRIHDAAAAGHRPDLVKACASAPAGLSTVLMRGIEATLRHASRDDIQSEMGRDTRRLSLKLRRGLGMLATLGTMSPFLGLFGTVLGVMQALRDIGRSGMGGMEVVATGVSEALVTTAAGILVAIVVVLMHQLLRAQLNRAVLEVQVLVEDVADALARVPAQALGNLEKTLGIAPVAAPNAAEASHVTA